MTRTKRRSPADTPFAALIRRDVFGETTPEERAHLESPAMVERTYVELVRVAQSIDNQMRDDLFDGDRERRRAAEYVRRKYATRIEQIKVPLGTFRDSLAGKDAQAMTMEITRLRGAIRDHQAASIAADLDPEPHDEELWAHVAPRT